MMYQVVNQGEGMYIKKIKNSLLHYPVVLMSFYMMGLNGK